MREIGRRRCVSARTGARRGRFGGHGCRYGRGAAETRRRASEQLATLLYRPTAIKSTASLAHRSPSALLHRRICHRHPLLISGAALRCAGSAPSPVRSRPRVHASDRPCPCAPRAADMIGPLRSAHRVRALNSLRHAPVRRAFSEKARAPATAPNSAPPKPAKQQKASSGGSGIGTLALGLAGLAGGAVLAIRTVPSVNEAARLNLPTLHQLVAPDSTPKGALRRRRLARVRAPPAR